MPFSFSDFPIGPGAFLGAGIYAVVSVVGTGPFVNDRETVKLNWSAICELDLQAELSVRRRPESIIPKTDCMSMADNPLLKLFGDVSTGLKEVCQGMGNPDLGGPVASAAREQERRAHAENERRINRAASQAGSRCECASSVYQAENKVPLAIYAGSARVITPPQVRNLTSELTRALRSPQCTGAWGA